MSPPPRAVTVPCHPLIAIPPRPPTKPGAAATCHRRTSIKIHLKNNRIKVALCSVAAQSWQQVLQEKVKWLCLRWFVGVLGVFLFFGVLGVFCPKVSDLTPNRGRSENKCCVCRERFFYRRGNPRAAGKAQLRARVLEFNLPPVLGEQKHLIFNFIPRLFPPSPPISSK